MNELLGTLKSELLRPLATLILPGAVTITPYFVLLRGTFPQFAAAIKENTAETILLATALSLLVGFMLEDAGSDIESWWDKHKKKVGRGERERVWYEYLRFAVHPEPIGQRYIRTLVLRLKFELGTAIGLIIGLPGCAILAWQNAGPLAWPPTSLQLAFAALFVVIAVSIRALFRWASEGHDLLHRARVELLRGSEQSVAIQTVLSGGGAHEEAGVDEEG